MNTQISAARVMELVDVGDSKSPGGDTVPVRVRPRAPYCKAAEGGEIPFQLLFFFPAGGVYVFQKQKRKCHSEK